MGGRMSAEWVTAIASAGTFAVIAAPAIAIVTELRETMESTDTAYADA